MLTLQLAAAMAMTTTVDQSLNCLIKFTIVL
jgi:hypothetical protein